MNIKPLGDMLLVQPQFEVVHGIIQMPDALRKVMTYGEVLDKGPKVSDAIKVGDNVFFGSWVGIKTEPDKQESKKLIKEFEIIGLVDMEG
jgi:co-chaperonin GroES (HSP10)